MTPQCGVRAPVAAGNFWDTSRSETAIPYQDTNIGIASALSLICLKVLFLVGIHISVCEFLIDGS